MPQNDPAATDPMILHGVVVDTESDESMRDMAQCFVEEFRRSGYDRDSLIGIFRDPHYAGPCLAYRVLGEITILGMIDECLQRWPGSGNARTE